MSTSRDFISQTFWYTLSKYSQVLVQFLGSILFARLLAPSDFGIVSMAMSVLGIGVLFADFGMPTAYIQREEIYRGHNRALFLYTLAATSIFLVLGIYLSSFIASFYDNPSIEIVSKLSTVSVSMIILTAFPLTILKRSLMFEKIALVSFIGLFVSMATILYFAVLGYGFLSLVFGSIARNIFCLIAYSYIALSNSLLAGLDDSNSLKESFLDLFGFGKWIIANRFLTYSGRQLDSILIGKYFDSTQLGLYNRAYNMMLLPLRKFSGVIAGVSLATLNKYQRDDEKLWNAFRKIITIELVIMVPITIIAWTYRYDLIVFLYSEKWVVSAEYLTYLFPVILFDLFRSTLAQSLVIKGYVRSQLIIGALTTLAILMGILYAISYDDIVTVVIAYSIIKVIIFFPTVGYYIYTLRRSFLDLSDILVINMRLYWPMALLAVAHETLMASIVSPIMEVLFLVAFLSHLYISLRMILLDSRLKYFSDSINLPDWILRLLLIKENR